MSESATTEKKGFKNWFKGLKREFGKIFWPDKKTVVKETTVVVIISVILGIIIAIIDFLIQYGMGFFIK
ncbi:MAG: preprotein translocase subunit SecE [Lachnospiraceae bacterium]